MPRVRAPAPNPTTGTITKAEAAAIDREANELVASMVETANGDPRAPSPVGIKPRLPDGFERLTTTVLDENVDVVAEYLALEEELEIKEALTPEVVRAALNRCESNARRAHRLYVLYRVQLDRFRIDAEVALGSMRDQAVAELTEEKLTNKRTKQVTDADVRERAASMHPDEWREISENLAKAESMLKHIERFADVWYRRSWSLSSLNG